MQFSLNCLISWYFFKRSRYFQTYVLRILPKMLSRVVFSDVIAYVLKVWRSRFTHVKSYNFFFSPGKSDLLLFENHWMIPKFHSQYLFWKFLWVIDNTKSQQHFNTRITGQRNCDSLKLVVTQWFSNFSSRRTPSTAPETAANPFILSPFLQFLRN